MSEAENGAALRVAPPPVIVPGLDGQQQPTHFEGIRISIASPEKMHSWSHGEVRKPETINYRTLKPERDGLFCPRIFGPVKDYECLCGKYRRMKHKGIVCEKCGVEVIQSKVRRERMGHIELASPVAHIWFLKAPPSSRMGLLLDMTLKDIESILYFERFVVLEPGVTPLPRRALLSEEQYRQLESDYGPDKFRVGVGAEAIRSLLAEIDLRELRDEVRGELGTTRSEMKRRKLAKRLKLVESFIRSGNRPEWMVMTVIPVIPPELRPLVPLDGGRFATSDLNDLYRRVINRNNRLKKLMTLRSPDIIIRNEKRMLQEAVDALFDNSRRKRPAKGANRRQLKSLSDIVTGKQGRFRQNLLGKRCDYSGRSVIVVGPELLLHQCGLPKKMALELFKPFIYSKLELYGHATAIKHAKRLVELEQPEVWDILEEVIREHPVLLNRAPTLHRLGIQAFEPVLVEGKAVQLHPLVCTAFNADFDGDQMAVHVPLSVEAQLEARVLMMSTNNILSPANGKPIIVPTQDIVLGIYYLSLMRDGARGEGMAFAGIPEIRHALSSGAVDLHARVQVRIARGGGSEVVETTPGRAMLSEILPDRPGIGFALVNRKLAKREVSELIDVVYRHCGQKETVIFADRLMGLGFTEACSAGISFGKDDMIVPESKERLVDAARGQVERLEKQYEKGLITHLDRYNRIVDVWTQCTDEVADAMMREVGGERDGLVNSIFTMVDSGARGSPMQMKQLAGMRGLITNTSGEIIETPIISNFKEGLGAAEFFNSTHGARKGLADTARKTSTSGYFTRRLVDVAQDVIITEEDCGTSEGIEKTMAMRGTEVIETLGDRIEGRHPAGDVVHPETGETLAPAGAPLGPGECRAIEEAGLDRVRVRTVLTCESSTGTCAACYGLDLARGARINLGEAVGVIAAQSIGEPGTQLTMRTFHIGGVAQSGSDQLGVESSSDGTVRFARSSGADPMAVIAKGVVMTRDLEILVEGPKGKGLDRSRVPYGAQLLVERGQRVKRGDRLAEWDPYSRPIVSETAGQVRFDDLRKGISVVERVDEATGLTSLEVVPWQGVEQSQADLRPRVTVVGDAKPKEDAERSYEMPVGAVLLVEDETAVEAGDLIARVQTEDRRSRDIVGGLPRVITLLDAPRPKKPAVLAELSGKVLSIEDSGGRTRISVGEAGSKKEEGEAHLVPRDRYVLVQEGDEVRRGDKLTDGNPVPHDILRVLGVEALAHHLVEEIQGVYRNEGVRINDKHIEVIVHQMLQKVQVSEPGDSDFLKGDEVDKLDFRQANAALAEEGKKPAEGVPVLQGITKSSRETKSFISAASFQETTRALTDAALAGKTDDLRGLKENVIVGRLIPAGTGNSTGSYSRTAIERDREAIAKKQALEEAAAAERPFPLPRPPA